MAVAAHLDPEAHPALGLGIDAGGTYTDAVIFDLHARQVVAKALTTYHDLVDGIRGALARLPGDLLACVQVTAPMESFFGSLKGELVHSCPQLPRAEARRQVFEHPEVFYNRQRLHSALGYQSPVSYERYLGTEAA